VSRAISSLNRYFGLKGFPNIHVIIAPDRREFDDKVRRFLRVPIKSPTHPGRIGQTQRHRMVLLSPKAYKSDSIYSYRASDFRRLIVHEMTHIYEEHLSPDIENAPRWWSEGLAVYLSRQWRWEDDIRKPWIRALQTKRIPGFSDIERIAKFSYTWAWTIIHYLDRVYGCKTIIKGIENCRRGNIFQALGMEPKILERDWRKWLLVRFAARSSQRS
jgi:hypothetical protein